MLANTINATAPTAALKVEISAAQARTTMMETTNAITVPKKPKMNAIVPRIFAALRSPLSQALSERAEKRIAKNPNGQLHVPSSVKMAMGK